MYQKQYFKPSPLRFYVFFEKVKINRKLNVRAEMNENKATYTPVFRLRRV